MRIFLCDVTMVMTDIAVLMEVSCEYFNVHDHVRIHILTAVLVKI